MKKAFSAVALLLVCLLLCPATVQADPAAGEFTLDEVGITLEIPAELYVLVRDDACTDALEHFGVTEADKDALLTGTNMYLNAVEENKEYEICVTMVASSLQSFGASGAVVLDMMGEELRESMESQGAFDVEIGYYDHPQVAFFVVQYTIDQGNRTIDYVQYYTIHDNKAINIWLCNYTGEVTEAQERMLKGVIDSVVFSDSQSAPEPAQSLYTDPDIGAAFGVPEGWSEHPLSQPRQYISAKFVRSDNNASVITFGSFDWWRDGMSEEERSAYTDSGFSRNAFDLEMFLSQLSDSDLASFLGFEDTEIKRVVYGSYTYILYETEQELDGISGSIPIMTAFTIQNGYGYQFQFSGSQDDPHYADFEAVLTSFSAE